MKLNVNERGTLIMLLNDAGGHYDTARIVHETQMRLGLSVEEHKNAGFIETPNGLIIGNNFTADIEIPDVVLALIKGVLARMEGRGELKPPMLPTYERFVLGKEPGQKEPGPA